MPLQSTSGAASYDAFGGGLAAVPPYIEDVFSTYLYTGNGSTQTIANGINLAVNGGLVWAKNRTSTGNHRLFDTLRGALNPIYSDLSSNQTTEANTLTAFNSNGFALGSDANINQTNQNFVSWSFREQPKFFDVVTYSGNGSNRTIAHDLGSVPGCILVKRTTGSVSSWTVYHRSLSATQFMTLNATDAVATSALVWNSTAPTNTVFSLGAAASVNASGSNYVAYLFAHNAGGFGLNNAENVISCGLFSSTGQVNLGYEPQWVMMKSTSETGVYTGDWRMFDNMRGVVIAGDDNQLFANSSRAEDYASFAGAISFNATGFNVESQGNYGTSTIYIAIRRGPMKVPSDATTVYNVISQTPTSLTTLTNSFASDMVLSCQRSNGAVWGFNVADKLRSSSITRGSPYLKTSTTAAESSFGAGVGFTLTNTNVQENFWNVGLSVSSPVVYDIFQRAPNFFDEVCYTGTGTVTTQAHNLAAVPELMIMKPRGAVGNWPTYTTATGSTQLMFLNTTGAAFTDANYWNGTTPTTSVFTVGTSSGVNSSGVTYVAYLFATCPRVSKVGSYTGTGTTQQIDCGFAAGARFVLIKRTNSTGDWYVWDSARGIVAGNDPYLLLNSTAAEVTSTDYVDTYSAGFEISSTAPAAINANGGTFIFLAIA